MIISHQHKFIFIKTHKTAGTSIELSLSRYCGEKDIITDLPAEDEKLRPANGVTPRNYLNQFPWDYTIKNMVRWLLYPDIRDRLKIKYGQHSEAKNIMKTLGKEKWDLYYKFCFERNPWDKVISFYFFYLHYSKTNMEFRQFVNDMTFFNNSYIYMDTEGKVMVDYIARYENMEAELQKISKTIGIPFDGYLPRAKSGIRPHNKHYSEYYTEETKQIVAEKCKDVIDLMGYKFETH